MAHAKRIAKKHNGENAALPQTPAEATAVMAGSRDAGSAVVSWQKSTQLPAPSPPGKAVAHEERTIAGPVETEARPVCTVGVADRDNKEIGPDAMGFSDPYAEGARSLILDLHIERDTKPTAEDMKLCRDITKVEHALQELYPETAPAWESRFRPYFVRLFYIAQLALEGDVSKTSGGTKKVGGRLANEFARAELLEIEKDLIDDEAPRIKNSHVRELARWAMKLSLVFLVAYAALMVLHGEPMASSPVARLLAQLGIDSQAIANLMLLWVGTFVGVCLSYAIRTHTFALSDLTKTDNDYLAPEVRLALAGAFATLLALLGKVGFGDVAVGKVNLSGVFESALMAFVVGAVLGIAEQSLSGTIEKRVGDAFGKTS